MKTFFLLLVIAVLVADTLIFFYRCSINQTRTYTLKDGIWGVVQTSLMVLTIVWLVKG